VRTVFVIRSVAPVDIVGIHFPDLIVILAEVVCVCMCVYVYVCMCVSVCVCVCVCERFMYIYLSLYIYTSALDMVSWLRIKTSHKRVCV